MLNKAPTLRLRRVVRTGGFFLLAAALAIPTFAVDRALLVGIDRYSDIRVPETPGAALDAQEVASFIQEHYDFAPEAVRLLLDEDATAAAIAENFEEWLIEGTSPGDRVFFLYAGHGSQLADDNGDEDDSWDETLAPYDVNPETGENQIRDDVLDSLIAQLTGRRAVLIFDSCHSGTISRGIPKLTEFPDGGGARYLPRPDQFDAWWAQKQQMRSAGSWVIEAGDTTDARVFDAPSEEVGKLSGIVVISAAGPNQLAYPIKVEENYRGALSYAFVEAHTPEGSRGILGAIAGKGGKATTSALGGAVTSGSATGLASNVGGGLTVAALEVAIDSGVKKFQQNGQLQGNQQPWFEVISDGPIQDQPLFGSWEQATEVAMNNPLAEREVEIRLLNDGSVFRRGENLAFEVTTNEPGYLYMMVFSEDRVATCIFPSLEDPDNMVDAGAFRLPRGDGYQFPVQEPFGRDVVVAVASTTTLPLCEKQVYSWDEVFERLDVRGMLAEVGQRATRGIGVRRKAEPAAAPAAAAPPMTTPSTAASATADLPPTSPAPSPAMPTPTGSPAPDHMWQAATVVVETVQ